jgi:hypothetical protein
MKRLTLLTTLGLSLSAFSGPRADISILLDTSGSMGNLIGQVRDGLWQTLNSLSGLKKDGVPAELRLGLIEYGSGVVDGDVNFMQVLTPLTSTHTDIAEKLFATQALGGTELVGTAINLSLGELAWTTEPEDFRAIVVAGNETIHQGEIPAFGMAEKAVAADTIVNTIFAGPQTITHFGGGFGGGFGPSFPVSPGPTEPIVKPEPKLNPIFAEWKKLAETGLGEGLNIDISGAMAYVESPFDKEIVSATDSLSSTFLPFGKNGQAEFEKMKKLNSNIKNSGAGSYISWGSYLGGSFSHVSVSSWDLVAASDLKDFDLVKIAEEDLPKKMQGLSLAEKLLIIEKNKTARADINTQIKLLQEKRKKFVDDYIANNANADQQNFAKALKDIIIKQLEAKGFTL